MDGASQGAVEVGRESLSQPMPTGYTLVRGTIDDLDDLLTLEMQAFTAPWTRNMFRGELSGNPFARFWLVREGHGAEPARLVAYLCYWIVFEEMRIMNLAVAPEQRRRGLARRLVERAVGEAGEAEVKRALLEVRASNQAARELYQRLGFQETGRRRDYYADPMEDAVLMAMEPLVPQR